MEYNTRFTTRMTLEKDDIDENPTYLAKASADIITNRLGLYEDLGFSPAELAEILLESEKLNPSQKDLIHITLKRIHAFDAKKYYLNEGYAL
ncbi:MAG: hypothetical protein IJJ41_09035 [Clostridia bacterium]|nr:hypothetical protein [Clostridia bacterium]